MGRKERSRALDRATGIPGERSQDHNMVVSVDLLARSLSIRLEGQNIELI